MYLCNINSKTLLNMGFFKSIIFFCAIFFSALFLHMKTSSIVKLFAFHEEENKNTTVLILLIMFIAALSITLYYSI